MVVSSLTAPNRTPFRETLRTGIKTIAILGAKATAQATTSVVAFTAEKSKRIVERYPRAVALGGVLGAAVGLAEATDKASKAGVSAANAASTRLLEIMLDKAHHAVEVQGAPSSMLAWLGVVAVGSALTGVGFRNHAKRTAQREALPTTVAESPVYDSGRTTICSTAGIKVEDEFYLTYDQWHEDTFSQPYKPHLGERLDAWMERKYASLKVWYAGIKAAHAAQSQPGQPYNPFPATTNIIGEPLLP